MPQIDDVLPHDKNLEEAVLSAVINNSSARTSIKALLNPGVFYCEAHRIICQAILALVDGEKPVDLLTVSSVISTMGQLEKVGGVYGLTVLAGNADVSGSIEYHFRILQELHLRRVLILLTRQAERKAFDLSDDIFDSYQWLVSQLTNTERKVGVDAAFDAKAACEEINEIVQGEAGEKRFYPIDDPGIDGIIMTSPGNLVNISGKSGAGKTSFVSYWARQLLSTYPNEVAFCWYTMEDEASKIIMNFISPELKLTHSQMHGKNYELSALEKEYINHAAKTYGSYDIEFFQKPAFISHIKAHFERFCAQRPGKFNILIIDNTAKLKDYQAHRFKSFTGDIDDHIASELFDLFSAVKQGFTVNIWCLHHLSKEQLSQANFTEGYRPREANIKGSTSLRDVATQGILINRPGEFLDVVQLYKDSEFHAPIQHLMILEVFKNRNGELGFFRYFADLGFKIFYALP